MLAFLGTESRRARYERMTADIPNEPANDPRKPRQDEAALALLVFVVLVIVIVRCSL